MDRSGFGAIGDSGDNVLDGRFSFFMRLNASKSTLTVFSFISESTHEKHTKSNRRQRPDLQGQRPFEPFNRLDPVD